MTDGAQPPADNVSRPPFNNAVAEEQPLKPAINKAASLYLQSNPVIGISAVISPENSKKIEISGVGWSVEI